jgi:hypothetical protein
VNPENKEANIPDDGILTPATEAIVPSKLRVLRQNGFWLYAKSAMYSSSVNSELQICQCSPTCLLKNLNFFTTPYPDSRLRSYLVIPARRY